MALNAFGANVDARVDGTDYKKKTQELFDHFVIDNNSYYH